MPLGRRVLVHRGRQRRHRRCAHRRAPGLRSAPGVSGDPRRRCCADPARPRTPRPRVSRCMPDRTFVRIVPTADGKAGGVECLPCALVRLRPRRAAWPSKPCPSRNTYWTLDTVIFSVGQRAGLAFIPEDAGVGVTRQRTIAVNPNTMAARGPACSPPATASRARPSSSRPSPPVIGRPRASNATCRARRSNASPSRSCRWSSSRWARSQARLEETVRVRRGSSTVPELAVSERPGGFRRGPARLHRRAGPGGGRPLPGLRPLLGMPSLRLRLRDACHRSRHGRTDRERSTSAPSSWRPGYEAFRRRALGGIRPRTLPERRDRPAVRAPALGLRPDGRARRCARPTASRRERIAFLQCVGSRDQSHDYCSAVCCMYATKEAVMAKEHDAAGDRHTSSIMDMRAFSKGYDAYYQRARGPTASSTPAAASPVCRRIPSPRDLVAALRRRLRPH